MSIPNDVPQYRLLADTFFAPKTVLAGSIVATHAPPGPHLMPLNEAAKEKMEEWYNEEHPTLDKNGDPNFEKMYKPHAIYRYAEPQAAEVHETHVLSEPTLNQTGELSLAESLYSKRDTDQRPGPAPGFAPPQDKVSEAEAVAVQSGAAVVAEEEKPADPRKAGIKVS